MRFSDLECIDVGVTHCSDVTFLCLQQRESRTSTIVKSQRTAKEQAGRGFPKQWKEGRQEL
jgi:hypothetical protein